MEEKYNFEKKKKVINNLIKKKLNRTCIIKKYENLNIKEKSDFCLYCESNIKKDIYCSLICKEIFENNLNKLNNNENVSFPSFEMLTNSSKEKYRNFLNDLKKKKIEYDKILIFYDYKPGTKEFNIFKKICSKFIFIMNYEKIYYEYIEFDIIMFKSNIKNINENNEYKNLPSFIKDELNTKCLYCKENINKENFYVLPKNYLLGLFCSKFCLNVFVSINEEYIRQPYKLFFILPHYYYFENKTLIENLKKNYNKKSNILITYNVNYISKKKFEIIEIVY